MLVIAEVGDISRFPSARQIHVQGQPACSGPISAPTATGCFDPHWSPDGKKIVFVIFTAARRRDIYTVNATARPHPDHARRRRRVAGMGHASVGR